ncbi:GNAT family N-acetyltransferase [Alteribacter lacisalsi]|uniref:GNAT family N-acetyltransferase n=1 Tax=Alteribacter lacisalsi TaxID=2045244 RepID=UPI001374D07C|nr:GNAT family N-acetyltransferase [Alteribacter lacisalsi]
MIRQLNVHERSEAENILAVQVPAYQVEADWINSTSIPGLCDTPELISQSGETFYGWVEGGRVCGILAVKMADQTADIHRLVVDPAFFRRGIAGKLLDHLEKQGGFSRIIVSTGTKNLPAVSFYLKRGFSETRTIIREGISLTSFQKDM